MLARLISTGSLLDKGYLFWDEPETNLNPKLIKTLAESIVRLASEGIQIFIATHFAISASRIRDAGDKQELQRNEFEIFSLVAESDAVILEQGDRIDDLHTIVSLDEELRQSDRFLDAEET